MKSLNDMIRRNITPPSTALSTDKRQNAVEKLSKLVKTKNRHIINSINSINSINNINSIKQKKRKRIYERKEKV